MAELTTKIRRWGNSFGIMIPLEVLRRKGFREGEEIDAILIKKGNVLRETFGTHKFSKSVKQLMKETDRDLYDV